jgi:hypothetical protein
MQQNNYLKLLIVKNTYQIHIENMRLLVVPCLLACYSLRTAKWIFMKFDTGEFYYSVTTQTGQQWALHMKLVGEYPGYVTL